MAEILRETDREQLNDKLRRLAEAWEHGDADGYAAEFAEDALYVAFDGTRMNGRVEIAEGHRPLFTRYLRGSKLHSELVEMRTYAPELVVIVARGAVLTRGQKVPSKRRLSVNTTVAARQGANWSFVAFQNTRYRPFAETLLGRLAGAFAASSRPTAASESRMQ